MSKGSACERRIVYSSVVAGARSIACAALWCLVAPFVSNAVYAQDTQAPSTPLGLDATAVSSLRIDLTWSASSDNVGVTRYILDRCVGEGCTNFQALVNQATRSYSHTGLKAATTYRYRVRARDAAGNYSSYSAIVSRATPPDTSPPTAPSGLRVTSATGTQVNLAWSASTDDVSVSRYLLERCRDVGCSSFAQIATLVGTSYSDSGRMPGTTYRYRVRARDGSSNHSGYSAAVSATTSLANRAPIANAGSPQTVFLHATVTLDGSASSDLDGNPLSYAWSLSSRPTGSAAVLSTATTPRPTFVADVQGTYQFRLVVNDGFVDSVPATVAITTTNSPPLANAGLDATAPVGSTVRLSGVGSSDVDGDALSYSWTIVSRPAGSTTQLTSTGSASPDAVLILDRPGTYVARLLVSDGVSTSGPDVVSVSTTNSPPAAVAGPDQSLRVGAEARLDGTQSSDADADPLTFRWSLTSPAGSQSALTTAAAAVTGFVIDRPGTYIAQLIVNDGTVDSVADTVVISTLNSAPLAVAGQDQNAVVGASVAIDGSASSDADGDALSYTWALVARPTGSVSALGRTDLPAVSFVPDRQGVYVVQLIVSDGKIDSQPDTARVTVVVATDSQAPVITVMQPVDGLATNQATVLLTGSLDEPATLTLNGRALSLDASRTFSSHEPLNEGMNEFDLRATDAAGNTARRTLRVVRDTQVPLPPATSLISIVLDDDVFVTVTGAPGAVESGATVRVENERTGAVSVTVASATGMFLLRMQAQPGDELRVTVIDGAGNASASSTQAIPPAHQGPRTPRPELISVAVGADGVAQVSGEAGAVDASVTVVLSSYYAGQATTVIASGDGSFASRLGAAAFETVYIHTVDAQGRVSDTIRKEAAMPTLVVDGPTASVAAGMTRVWGRVAGPVGTTVTIGDSLARLTVVNDEVRFDGYTRAAAGQSAVPVTVHLPDGRVLSQEVTVTVNGDPAVMLEASPTFGVAPLSVTFQVVGDERAETSYDSFELDAQGDGIFEKVVPAGTRIVEVFTVAGSHSVTARLIKDGLIVRTLHALVTVSSAVEAENAARTAVNQFMSALAGQQVELALARMTVSARARYRDALHQLRPQLPQIIAAITPPEVSHNSATFVEFVLTREVAGVRSAYFATVIRGRDGQWRIDSI